MIIKLSKEKLFIDNLFKEDDYNLTLKKLTIQDEIKTKVIERNYEWINKYDKNLKELKEQLEFYKKNNKVNIEPTDSTKKTDKNKIAYKRIQFSNNKNTKKEIVDLKKKHKHIKNKSCIITDSKAYTPVSLNDSININNNDNMIKKMLNLDFATEKYNIISTSPIQTPGNINLATSPGNKQTPVKNFTSMVNNASNQKRFSRSIDFNSNSFSLNNTNSHYQTQRDINPANILENMDNLKLYNPNNTVVASNYQQNSPTKKPIDNNKNVNNLSSQRSIEQNKTNNSINTISTINTLANSNNLSQNNKNNKNLNNTGNISNNSSGKKGNLKSIFSLGINKDSAISNYINKKLK